MRGLLARPGRLVHCGIRSKRWFIPPPNFSNKGGRPRSWACLGIALPLSFGLRASISLTIGEGQSYSQAYQFHCTSSGILWEELAGSVILRETSRSHAEYPQLGEYTVKQASVGSFTPTTGGLGSVLPSGAYEHTLLRDQVR